ncbi:hypothetical protein JM49_10735 [Pseudomonas chlororaphis subsp. aurantiaca]|nr:hypothetical protein JM49_10735 [Pseudomonas chlororaphis subsp. aurantiaca]
MKELMNNSLIILSQTLYMFKLIGENRSAISRGDTLRWSQIGFTIVIGLERLHFLPTFIY